MTDIGVGDVALDLAQGRPVHVLDDTGQTADEWSDANNYELTENYGNSRLGASDDDCVFDVVYCSNAKSEPSKTYAMPESRLLRIETEAADDGRQVYERVAVEVLSQLWEAAFEDDANEMPTPETYDTVLDRLTEEAAMFGIKDEARELADVEQTIGGDDD